MSRQVALQLYSVREPAAEDFVGTLRRVAEMGYQGVEFAGHGGLSAAELRAALDELGLTAVGSHISFDALDTRLAEEVAYQEALGSRYAVCPYLDPACRYNPSQPEAWQHTLAVLERAGRAFRDAGIQFGYHNHWFEFEEKVGNQWLFDALFAATDADLVCVELDTCWAERAGQSAIAYLARYAGRVPLIHLKDTRRAAGGEVQTVPLGDGDIQLRAVVEAADAAGVEWLIVEQDYSESDPLSDVAKSMQWLRDNGIVAAR
ncbi:sugar phosphate isomerase/epimerase family protein [Alicyclobacillus shizuokensis]|uniref:sugar phosphate isomerase/epimerase family protein n=1 Tax=Alicyclobacillus shizuokensis TaxID=392014 RepID=UPI00082F1761|nr:sugar phosphate isomerase/epimerase [Alicyclobacillus shizuokensis]